MMLAILLATGLIGGSDTSLPGGTTDVVTPALRTITLTPTGAIAGAGQQLDPNEIMDYQIDMKGLLAVGEAFQEVELRVSAVSQLQGFVLMQTAPYVPVVIPGTSRVRFWATIQEAVQGQPQWQRGLPCQVEFRGITNSNPPRHWQRTVQVMVLNK